MVAERSSPNSCTPDWNPKSLDGSTIRVNLVILKTMDGVGQIVRSTVSKGPSRPLPSAGRFLAQQCRYRSGSIKYLSNPHRLPYMLDLNDRTPFCNTSWSVRRTEELIGQLITETRSQLKCNCIEPCTKVTTTNLNMFDSTITGGCISRLSTCTRASHTL